MNYQRLDRSVEDAVRAAVVSLPRVGGQGVLVPGNVIITAAHCVAWTADGGMVLGDHFREQIVTAEGKKLMAAPRAVEPVQDIAVLGDFDEPFDASEAFQAFCSRTQPVALERHEFELFEPVPAFVFTHTGKVITVQARQCATGAPNLVIQSDEPIEGGTSGGPVVTSQGHLLGVVSNTGGIRGEASQIGGIPRVHLTVPAWIAKLIEDTESADDSDG